MRHALVLLFALACAAPPPADDPDTDPTDTEDTDAPDSDDTDPVDTDTDDTDPVDTDTDDTDPVDTDPAPETCKAAEGLCTVDDACDAAAILPAFADDCVFDDGPGVCCEAPPLQPSGNTCPSRGGVCAPIGGCLAVDGWLAPTPDCTNAFGASYTCCVPESQCGPAAYDCCTDETVFRSTCDRGTETCAHLPGTRKEPIGTCVVP